MQANDATMQPESSLQRLIRGLLWIGTGLLVGAALAIIWAVFQTRGVDDFLTALTVAGLGFGLPSVIAFSVAWLLSSFEYNQAGDARPSEVAALATPRQPSRIVLAYLIAIAAVGAAWAIRLWIAPFVGGSSPFASFYLAVAVAGWLGGLGPAVFASLLSFAIAWFFVVPPEQSLRLERFEDLVGLGAFVAGVLGIAGITAGLRVARENARRMAQQVIAHNATLESTRAELEHERDRFRVTLNGIGEAVIATDANATITYMNPAAEQMTGWKLSEATNVALGKVFHVVDQETRGPVESQVTRAINTGRAQPIADRTLLLARGGREIPVDDNAAPILDAEGKVVGVVLVFRDAGEGRRARASLAESEQRFRTVADQSPALLWLANADRNRVYFNRAWLAFTGRRLEEEQGDGWTSGVHPEDYAHCVERMNAAFADRKPFRMEYRLRRSDGEYRWICDQGTPSHDAQQRFAGFAGAALDITDAREERASAGQDERRTSEFIATLAHELRNPLAPIRSAVQIIARLTTGRDPRLDHAREVVDRQSALLTTLIDDLLDVSRIETGKITLKRESVAVQDFVRQAVEANQPLVKERGHALNVTVPHDPLYVEGDVGRLAQALGNLISNAAKFTPDGGQIDVTARREDDGSVEVAVTDNGIGIDPSLLPIVFDLFREAAHATRHPRGGLGLGLTIVRRLVEMHGGSVSAASEGPGKGSRFALRLPVASRMQDARTPTPETRAPRIMVVDDNVDAATAIATLLEIGGYWVMTAHDPQSAIEKAQSTVCEVIVLDIGLPGMSGYELATRLRAPPVSSRARLVALTGYGQSTDEGAAKAAGFSGYLVKPVDADQLLALVAELTRARGMRRA